MILKSRMIGALSFKLNYALSGFQYTDYHLVNLVIHVLAGILLYGVIRRTLMSSSLRAVYGSGAHWLALIAALLWTVHPLQTESGTYICQRFESLMGMFYLLTLYCFIRASDSPRKHLWYCVAVLVCSLGMATKEIMVTAPVIVLAYDYVFLSRSMRELWRTRKAIHAALFSTCARS